MRTMDPSNRPSKPLSVLIVDDTPKNLQVLGSVISREGYRVAAATHGVQALEMVGVIRPDLILLDIMMPEMDGFEVCRRLQASAETRDIPVIFLTARSESEDIVKGFEVGAVDYLTKPFNTAELVARVRSHLELKRTQDLRRQLIAELREALEQIKQLYGLLPICPRCKKIRDDAGFWQQVEAYVSRHCDVSFSHSICPDCLKLHFPEIAARLEAKAAKPADSC